MTDESKELAPATEVVAEPNAGDAPRITPNIAGTMAPEEVERITADLIGALKTVYDPEIPVDIYELGVEGIQNVTINMVYDPPWDASRMSEEAQVALNWW